MAEKNTINQYEKLGLFYIGKKLDAKTGKASGEYLLYDSKDLTTHAVCIGMTGSGKTGLCVSILEEAAIDGIPSIIVDPKGDLGNLLLTFPELRGEDFLPWINQSEALKNNLSAEAFAEQQAILWKNGLADWNQDTDRITRLRAASDFVIYTPGSNAGLPVSIVSSFSAPAGEDLDLLRERVQTTVSGLLNLLGIDADPLQSREHILLSNIIEHCWVKGQNLDLNNLIHLIQSPPIDQIGVFTIDDFFPSAARIKLAMSLNNLLAAPGFKAWMEGESLDINQMIYTNEGKPRSIIFSIAHLSDAERMFFVTLLLNQVLGWIRSQPGSTSLRGILYMDEVFGFLPPVSEPPSKRPLLTLLKQARAFGLGVVLATQNPVDLDYKGLSNAGTWFIGRLQTQKDKERLADGLIRGDSGDIFDKKTLMNTISSLKKREFLLHNVHEKQPQFFGTRWVLSYLCGPLTRTQIKNLMQDRKKLARAEKKLPRSLEEKKSEADLVQPPQIPSLVRQSYAPVNNILNSEGKVIYHLYLIASSDIAILSSRYAIAQNLSVAYALQLNQKDNLSSWSHAEAFTFNPELLAGEKIDGAAFSSPPTGVFSLSTYEKLDKKFESFVYKNYYLSLWKSTTWKSLSHPGESERDFRIRLKQSANESRDLEVDRIKRKFAKKLASLEKQLQRAQQIVDKEVDQYENKMLDSAISVGSSLLGALLGGGRTRSGITRATRSASRIRKEKQDITRAKEKQAQVESHIRELERQFDEEISKISLKFDPLNEKLSKIIIRPKKADILQKYFGLIWVPYLYGDNGTVQSLNKNIG